MSIDRLDVEALANELDDLREAKEEWDEENKDSDKQYPDQERIDDLQELEDDLGDLHVASGEKGPFVSENDFEEYAQELAEECGYIQRGAAWPYTCIDWSQAADELRSDYTTVDFDGSTFLYRN